MTEKQTLAEKYPDWTPVESGRYFIWSGFLLLAGPNGARISPSEGSVVGGHTIATFDDDEEGEGCDECEGQGCEDCANIVDSQEEVAARLNAHDDLLEALRTVEAILCDRSLCGHATPEEIREVTGAAIARATRPTPETP